MASSQFLASIAAFAALSAVFVDMVVVDAEVRLFWEVGEPSDGVNISL